MYYKPDSQTILYTAADVEPYVGNNPALLTEDDFKKVGIYRIIRTQQPEASSRIKRVVNALPILINGEWLQQWQEIDLTLEELQILRTAHVNEVKILRDRKTAQGGFPVVVNGTTKWFHSDPLSRTQHLGLMILGSNMPSNIQWKTMDGSFVTMDPSIVTSIFASATQQDIALFNHAQTLIDQVNAAQDPTTVDINAGWPATYQN